MEYKVLICHVIMDIFFTSQIKKIFNLQEKEE